MMRESTDAKTSTQGKKRQRKGGDSLLPNLLNHSRRLEYSTKSQVTIEDGKNIARTQDLVRIFQHLLPNKSSVRDNIAKVRLSYCS